MRVGLGGCPAEAGAGDHWEVPEGGGNPPVQRLARLRTTVKKSG
jgi:hypothetical protein